MYKDDTIFLLSIKEYQKYKKKIPQINCWWWLRSPGYYFCRTTCVLGSGSVYSCGDLVDRDNSGVRPALKFSNYDWFFDSNKKYKISDRIIAYQFPWIVIDKDLAIAEVPIAFHKFDLDSNDYEISEIRHFLFNWIKERRR